MLVRPRLPIPLRGVQGGRVVWPVPVLWERNHLRKGDDEGDRVRHFPGVLPHVAHHLVDPKFVILNPQEIPLPARVAEAAKLRQSRPPPVTQWTVTR